MKKEYVPKVEKKINYFYNLFFLLTCILLSNYKRVSYYFLCSKYYP